MRHILYLLLLFGFVTPLSAQVQGTVKDNTSTPIIGANILWMNGSTGTITNEEGDFSIDLPNSDERRLIVSGKSQNRYYKNA